MSVINTNPSFLLRALQKKLGMRTASSESKDEVSDPDENFRGGTEGSNPYYPNQKDLNDLIRDFRLTKSNAELLMSRLKQ
ncbi:hypothetical protein J437_LFUL014827 [Ladona fulva]|uniref:Uncharacterized protein n=1 Tax=Ladona fulva TaxID=123851 RepID=A0A8K0KI77_LADFU|nr:hypothetical protein J437_LFUL014827 [Ladona fulva]